MAIVSDRLGQIEAVLAEFGAGDPADLRRALREYDVRDIVTVIASTGNGNNDDIQVGAVQVVDFLFNEPDVAVPYPITAVDQGTPSVTIAGDHTSAFPLVTLGNTPNFEIIGSTGNDGTYTLVSATLVGGDTVLECAEPLADATVDGNVPQALIATWDVPARASVLDMQLIPEAAPWADSLQSTAFSAYDSSSPDTYFGYDLDPIQSGTYDPTSIVMGQNLVNLSSGGLAYGLATGGGGASPSSLFAEGSSGSGAGIPYPNGDTITMLVGGIATGGGGGILRVRIYYVVPPEPVVAT